MQREPSPGAAGPSERDEALFRAVLAGGADAVAELLETHPATVHARDDRGRTPLHAAVAADRPDLLARLADAGADLDARSDEGRTALHDAIEDGRDACRDLLIERGAAVDVCAAAILGDLPRLTALLDEDPERANERSTGLSPLCWAAFGRSPAAAALLIARGARMDDGELQCAAAVGRVPTGRLLLAHGADPDALHAGSGCNALHAAATMAYTSDGGPFVRLLLEHGADPSVRAADGRTALEMAREGEAAEEREAPAGGRKDWAAVIGLLETWEGGRATRADG